MSPNHSYIQEVLTEKNEGLTIHWPLALNVPIPEKEKKLS